MEGINHNLIRRNTEERVMELFDEQGKQSLRHKIEAEKRQWRKDEETKKGNARIKDEIDRIKMTTPKRTLQAFLNLQNVLMTHQDDMPEEVINKEKEIIMAQPDMASKPAEIAEKMVVGRMKKFTGEVSLTGQAFIMEPKKSVGEILKEKNATVTGFVRMEVGAGIEKKEEDFAAEVAAQIAAAKAK